MQGKTDQVLIKAIKKIDNSHMREFRLIRNELRNILKAINSRNIDGPDLVTGSLKNIIQKLNTLSRDNRRNGEFIRETLWHASGKLPQYEPRDGRSVNAVKEAMVQTAIDRLLAGSGSSPRAILKSILRDYADIPGSYDSLTPFQRQVERVMRK